MNHGDAPTIEKSRYGLRARPKRNGKARRGGEGVRSAQSWGRSRLPDSVTFPLARPEGFGVMPDWELRDVSAFDKWGRTEDIQRLSVGSFAPREPAVP